MANTPCTCSYMVYIYTLRTCRNMHNTCTGACTHTVLYMYMYTYMYMYVYNCKLNSVMCDNSVVHVHALKKSWRHIMCLADVGPGTKVQAHTKETTV